MSYRPNLCGNSLITISALALGACTQSINVQVVSEVPIALVQTLPLSVGVHYTEAIRQHKYLENTEERPNWAIASGASQVAMFDRVLSSTFDNVVSLDTLPTQQSPVSYDIVLVPTIREVQLATPQGTFFEFYEAWIRYEIDMLDGHGRSLGSWEMTAYGKAPQKRFTLRSAGVNDAFSLALRDAGAKLLTSVVKQPAVIEKLPSPR